MEAIGVFAVAVGVVCIVAIAAISLRGPRRRRRGFGWGGPMIPMPRGSDDGGDDFDGG